MVVTEQIHSKCFLASPIAHVHKVQAPVLITLGDVDLRVPPTQGKEFYHALCARKVVCKLMNYPQNDHPIDKPTEECDNLLHHVLWLRKYL